MVHRFKPLSSIIGLFSALLILGTVNHCVFEDTFASLAKMLFRIEVPSHLLNHAGSATEHTHSDSSGSHQHGEPHPILVLLSEKPVIHLVFLLSAVIAIVCRFMLALRFRGRSGLNSLRTDQLIGDPPGLSHLALTSLSSAPQAPPMAALFA